MTSQAFPILLSLFAALLGAVAQFFFKSGSTNILEIPIYKNLSFLGGLALFWCVLLLIMMAFRFGGKLSVVYPVYGSTYIWALVISRYILKEQVGMLQVSGVLLIIVGIGLIAKPQ